jgi:eukaryotic-like serine/threonine-protein kinase
VPGFAEERVLGSGASGRVVAAVRVASGTRVAVKYLSPGLFGDPGFLAAFRGEARLLMSLADPHVVRLFGYVEEPGQGAAIVMELVSGVSLHQLITSQGPTAAESALVVLKGSLLGLAAAHALGIVHRDYKPENVLVDAEGTSKLTDFGVAARQGSSTPASGTPLYMAPEQWDGAPATPATDIYAATAVFFECLTGRTPFSGGQAQLAVLHAAAAVPVELVDEPLRELIARGMAKDPAARPASVTALAAELEATATAAYGPGWEARGRSQLAGRVAALLLLLLRGPAPAVGGGTGITNVTTTLAPRAAIASRAGLSGWRLAAAYAALFVVVFGAVTGAVVAKYGNSAHNTASSQSGAPGATAAAGLGTAACGSSGEPALAYVTFTGTAQVPAGGSVVVRCGTRTPRTLGSLGTTGYIRPALAWSSDGTQLGWLTASAVYVAQAKAGAWSVRHWACQGCVGMAFLGKQAVAVSSQAAGGAFATAIPQLLVFPATGSGQPAALPVTGIATIGLGTEFNVLGSVSPTDLVVSYGTVGGTAGGSPVLYRVNAAGQATQYQYQPPHPNEIIGVVSSFTASQASGEFAFSTSGETNAFCFATLSWALDTATGAIISPKTPATGGGPNPGPTGWLVEGTWVDRTGTPYASLVPSPSDCATNTTLKSAGITPIVCKLSGGNWVPMGRGVFQAAYGPGKWLAEEAGVTVQNDFHPEALAISDGIGTTSVTVPNVDSFAWAP